MGSIRMKLLHGVSVLLLRREYMLLLLLLLLIREDVRVSHRLMLRRELEVVRLVMLLLLLLALLLQQSVSRVVRAAAPGEGLKCTASLQRRWRDFRRRRHASDILHAMVGETHRRRRCRLGCDGRDVAAVVLMSIAAARAAATGQQSCGVLLRRGR